MPAPANERHRAAAPPSCNTLSAAICRTESKYQALGRPGEGTLGVVCVGDVIEPQANDSVLRGHGTLLRSGSLVASRCGRVQRWNQLVLVEPLAGAYAAAVGHVVVGRIVQVRGLVHECEFKSQHTPASVSVCAAGRGHSLAGGHPRHHAGSAAALHGRRGGAQSS